MSDLVTIAGGYALDKYLLSRPFISVQSSMAAGTFSAKETVVSMKYVRGLFDGDALFRNGSSIVITNGTDTLFTGFLSSAITKQGLTTLTCNTSLHRALLGVADFEVTGQSPAAILKTWLDSLGIQSFGLEYTVSEYASMLASVYAPKAQNTKGYDLVSALADMMSADVAIMNDKVVFYDRDAPFDGYEITKIMDYPEMVDDGSSRSWPGVSIPYVYDADVPYQAGDQNSSVWSADFGNSSAFQLIGFQSAAISGTIRMARYGKPHPVYKIKVRRSATPVILGAWYIVNRGTMAGRYRLTGYDTDGECYFLMLEAE